MLKLLVGTSLASAAAFSVGAGASAMTGSRSAVQMASCHDFEATAIDGKKVEMKSFKGKPILVLNVASL